MSLENYLNKLIKKGFLKEENIGIEQIKILLVTARKNLTAAKKNLDIDEETCYTMAYNAMLKMARAVVLLKGLRPHGHQQHKVTIEATGQILGQDFKSLINKFDKMRKVRNKFIYEPLLPLSRVEALRAIKTATEFHNKVRDFLKQANPQLELF